ncbi:hypothetical protein HOT99_gp216 [Caulobacter phage CcrBL10]|uniref:Uncharacterized protein n=1 Tax=Caulobacter phage CcrBL10 TaxID=2283269 RepID=A0A385E972_9CAUD|nr:hypothetical protein HOT99_gp216 [Caulobacter phage CcrBL10]AXQ68401.1 hypothetical protein CcrBL10_gp197c [Caulobacter phage CcrBL10]
MLKPLRKIKQAEKKSDEQLEIEAREEVVLRRAESLKVLDTNPTTFAMTAGVEIKDLSAYLDTLRGLSLVDVRSRQTVSGAAYRVLVDLAADEVRQGRSPNLFATVVPRRSIWAKVGGSEEAFNTALENLRFADLAFETGEDSYVVL